MHFILTLHSIVWQAQMAKAVHVEATQLSHNNKHNSIVVLTTKTTKQ